jgi:hypothetical protein
MTTEGDDLKARLRASIARAGVVNLVPPLRHPSRRLPGSTPLPDRPTSLSFAVDRSVPLPPVTKLPPGKKGGKKRAESDLCAEIIDALVQSGRVLVIRDEGGKVVFPHRNVIRRTPYGYFGLGVGSPDIVGVLLRCDVGTCRSDAPGIHCPHGGLFLGIEAKLPDDPEPDDHQAAWHDAARAAGACIIVARSAEEAIAGLP